VPSDDGEHVSVLQEDDGLTFAAAQGRCYRTMLTVQRSGNRVTVQADVEGDGYAEFVREEFRLVVHGASPAAVEHDGASIQAEQGAFRLPNAGQPFTASFTV
jgi:alpha-glucosidase